MKRFFTKKSVAIIFTTIIILVGFFSFNQTLAQDSAQMFMDPPTDSVDGQKAAKDSGGGLGIANMIGNAIGKVVDGVVGSTINIVTIASICLAIAGTILDYSVQYTIYGVGFDNMTTSVREVWVLLRDTANIIFIFALLYAAIKQIIFGEASKKMLTSVIIAAVLINFSLFISKIFIDASNLVASSLYNQITVVATGTSGNAVQNLLSGIGGSVKSGTSLNSITSEIDLSGILMDSLKLTTIYDVSGAGAEVPMPSMVGVGAVITAFTGLILILISTFVFIALAALLIGRFLMLVILMATSPMGFVGDIIPGFSNISKNWWKSLQDQSLIAPAIMFFMLLTIKLSQAVGTMKNPDTMILLFNFFLVAYLLLKSVSITKGLSGAMGGFIDKITGAATGIALGAATGGTAFLARQTVGRGATALASKYGQRLETLGAKGGIMGSLANVTNTGIKGTAKSAFDMRNTTVLKSTLEQTAKAGMNIDKSALEAGGKYGKGTGYTGMMDKRKKEAEEQGKKYDESAGKTIKADKEKIEDYDKKIANIEAEILLETDSKRKMELEQEAAILENEKRDNTSFGIEEEKKTALKHLSENALGVGKNITTEVENKKGEISNVQHIDFGGADAKIKAYEEEKKKKRKKAEDEIFIKKGLGDAAAVTAIENQLKIDEQKIEADIKTEKENLNKARQTEKEKLEGELEALETLNKNMVDEASKMVESQIMNSENANPSHKFLLDRFKMKQNYADNQRDSILNMLKLMTAAERESLASAAENANYDKDKAREDATQKKLMKDLLEQWKKDNPS